MGGATLMGTKTTTWVRKEGALFTVGISCETVNELGEIAWVGLPKADSRLVKGDVLTVIESTKAAFDIESPLSGHVEVVNNDLEKTPQLLNSDAEGAGWICKIRAD